MYVYLYLYMIYIYIYIYIHTHSRTSRPPSTPRRSPGAPRLPGVWFSIIDNNVISRHQHYMCIVFHFFILRLLLLLLLLLLSLLLLLLFMLRFGPRVGTHWSAVAPNLGPYVTNRSRWMICLPGVWFIIIDNHVINHYQYYMCIVFFFFFSLFCVYFLFFMFKHTITIITYNCPAPTSIFRDHGSRLQWSKSFCRGGSPQKGSLSRDVHLNS